MKRFGVLIILSLLSQLFLFTGCGSKDNPITPSDESGKVDQRLIGTWVNIDTLPDITSPYNIVVNSFTITTDKEIVENGWEFSTGRLLPSESPILRSLHTASDGILSFTRFTPPDVVVDSFSYRIESNFLIIEKPDQKITYKKHEIGDTLLTAIHCATSFSFRNEVRKNISPAVKPSSYIETVNGEKGLFALTNGYHLRINIPDFNGIGAYPIQYNQAVLTISMGDVFISLRSDSLATGELLIQSYDPVKKICSGTFTFSIINHFPYPDTAKIQQVTNGQFTVPVID